MTGSTPDTDLYPTITYRDPLLFPLYLRTNDSNAIQAQAEGDWLLNTYINKIDVEIVDDIKEFAEQKEIVVEIMDNCRIHGWCAVQFYSDESHHVFSSPDRTKWLTELDPNTNKKVLKGVSVTWTDAALNVFNDDLYFEEQVSSVKEVELDSMNKVKQVETQQTVGKAYLFIWKKGHGQTIVQGPECSAFAEADLNTAILSLAIQCRQIQSTLLFSSTNPFFYHFKYGDSITSAQRTALLNQMSYVNISNGIGAKEAVLKEIVAIENAATEKAILGLDQFISFFASACRVPLSYFLAEKQTGGLGDTGETEDEAKLMLKKQFILSHFLTGLSELFSAEFGITLPDLSQFYQQKADEKAQKQQDLMNQNKPPKVNSE